MRRLMVFPVYVGVIYVVFLFVSTPWYPAFIPSLSLLLLLHHLWVFEVISTSFLPIHHFLLLHFICYLPPSSSTNVLTVFTS